MKTGEHKYLVALNNFPKFGPVRMKKLKAYFPSAENIFNAAVGELIRAGIEKNIAHEFTAARNNINPEALLEKLGRENIKIVTLEDRNYPKLLREIYDPPHLLYYRGEIKGDDEFSLAVVGTRKFTAYGQQVTGGIVRNLAKNNFTITSGLSFLGPQL